MIGKVVVVGGVVRVVKSKCISSRNRMCKNNLNRSSSETRNCKNSNNDSNNSNRNRRTSNTNCKKQ